MRPLHPPLQVIESGLFAAAPTIDASTEAHEEPEPTAAHDVAVPAYLRDAFARRAAALALRSDAPFERGQIRVANAVLDPGGRIRRALEQPVAALLRMQIDGRVWRAWIVSAETDYATDSDVVLAERDAPVDPLAGMVQTWNETRIVLAPDARLLAWLPPARMQQIEAVSAEASVPGEPGRPGLVVLRQTADGHPVATGSGRPVPGDPRVAYQQLYRRLAREFDLAAVEVTARAPAAPPSSTSAWQRIFGWRGAFAAVFLLLVVQSGLMVSMLPSRSDDAVERGLSRGGEHPGEATRPALRVIFAPDVPLARIQRALRDIGGTIVAGPNEHGEFIIVTTELTAAEAIARLRLAGVVDSADEVPGGVSSRR